MSERDHSQNATYFYRSIYMKCPGESNLIEALHRAEVGVGGWGVTTHGMVFPSGVEENVLIVVMIGWSCE